jgi:hypothetical protein
MPWIRHKYEREWDHYANGDSPYLLIKSFKKSLFPKKIPTDLLVVEALWHMTERKTKRWQTAPPIRSY